MPIILFDEKNEIIGCIHAGWKGAYKGIINNVIQFMIKMGSEPKNITAALIGVKSKLSIFYLQRWINDYPEESLTAILPGAALQELWRVVSVVENLLLVKSVVVIFTRLIGMTAIIFSGLNERRREMAIWRAMGASPRTIIGLLMLEAFFISLLSIIISTILLFFSLAIKQIHKVSLRLIQLLFMRLYLATTLIELLP